MDTPTSGYTLQSARGGRDVRTDGIAKGLRGAGAGYLHDVDSADGLDPDFRKHKARIATYVPPTMFPATGARIVAEARRNNAPAEVLRLLKQLKQGHRFASAQQFWSALGLG